MSKLPAQLLGTDLRTSEAWQDRVSSRTNVQRRRHAVTQPLPLHSSLGLNFGPFICSCPKFPSGEEFGSALRPDIVPLTAETPQNSLVIFLWEHKDF